MPKKARATIIAMGVCIAVLAGLLIYSRVDAARYKRYKNVISQEEVRHTLFGQPISADRSGEYRIGVE